MDQPMQSISLTATTTPTRTATGGSVRAVLASLRAKARSFRVRTQFGPVMGDHVLGDGQWRAAAGSYPTR